MEEQKQYYQELAQQISSRDSQNQQKAKADDEQQRLHFQQWDTFWGRPGYGAPREGRNPHKENLMKLLHYPHAKVNYLTYLIFFLENHNFPLIFSTLPTT